jgi:AbrB family looped-hinge helix DNA binding protein
MALQMAQEWYTIEMVTTLTVDKAGRVVLPKPVREELQLAPGDSLELESSEDRIILRPARGGRMYKKKGVWVFHSGVPLTQDAVDRTVRRVRRERERQIMGKTR